MSSWRVASFVVLTTLALALGATAAGAQTTGKAEITLTGPSSAQSTSTPFDVTVTITRADATWAVYNLQLAYDTTVLQVENVKRLPLANCDDASWGVSVTKPTLIIACAFQESTATGPADTITLRCLKDGSSELHLVSMAEDSIQGSTLMDFNALPIATDLKDAPVVTCGAGGPLSTVAIPTNPPQSAVQTAIARGPATPQSDTQRVTQTSSDSGLPAWLIAVIIVVVLGAAGAAGWLVLKRRGGASGG